MFASSLENAAKKAMLNDKEWPKRKHVRNLVLESWQHESGTQILTAMEEHFKESGTSALKGLITLHSLSLEGHPHFITDLASDRIYLNNIESHWVQNTTSLDKYASLIVSYAGFLRLRSEFFLLFSDFNGNWSLEAYLALPNKTALAADDAVGLDERARDRVPSVPALIRRLLALEASAISLSLSLLSAPCNPDEDPVKMPSGAGLVPLISDLHVVHTIVTHFMESATGHKDFVVMATKYYSNFALLRRVFENSTHPSIASIIAVPTLPSDPPRFKPAPPPPTPEPSPPPAPATPSSARLIPTIVETVPSSPFPSQPWPSVSPTVGNPDHVEGERSLRKSKSLVDVTTTVPLTQSSIGAAMVGHSGGSSVVFGGTPLGWAQGPTHSPSPSLFPGGGAVGGGGGGGYIVPPAFVGGLGVSGVGGGELLRGRSNSHDGLPPLQPQGSSGRSSTPASSGSGTSAGSGAVVGAGAGGGGGGGGGGGKGTATAKTPVDPFAGLTQTVIKDIKEKPKNQSPGGGTSAATPVKGGESPAALSSSGGGTSSPASAASSSSLTPLSSPPPSNTGAHTTTVHGGALVLHLQESLKAAEAALVSQNSAMAALSASLAKVTAERDEALHHIGVLHAARAREKASLRAAEVTSVIESLKALGSRLDDPLNLGTSDADATRVSQAALRARTLVREVTEALTLSGEPAPRQLSPGSSSGGGGTEGGAGGAGGAGGGGGSKGKAEDDLDGPSTEKTLALLFAARNLAKGLENLLAHAKGWSRSLEAASKAGLLSAARRVVDDAVDLVGLGVTGDVDPEALLAASGKVTAAVEALIAAAQSARLASAVAEEDQDETPDFQSLNTYTSRELSDAISALRGATVRLAAARTSLPPPSEPAPKGPPTATSVAILDSAGVVTEGTARLMEAAAAIQVGSASVKREGVAAFKEDRMWSEGLVSASRYVADATTLLVEAAESVVAGEQPLAFLVVSSKSVIASTAQLLAAARARGGDSAAQHELSEAANSVLACTRKLVSEVQDAAPAAAAAPVPESSSEEVTGRPRGGSVSMTAQKIKEMELNMKVLRLEKEIDDARSALSNLRRSRYVASTPTDEQGKAEA